MAIASAHVQRASVTGGTPTSAARPVPYIYPAKDQQQFGDAGVPPTYIHAYFTVEVANATEVSIIYLRGYTDPQGYGNPKAPSLKLTYSYKGPLRLSAKSGVSWQGTSTDTTVENIFLLAIQGKFTIHACNAAGCANEPIRFATR